MSDKEKKPEDDGTLEQKKADKGKPAETPRFGGFIAPSSSVEASADGSFILHINELWKSKLSNQVIGTFLNRFFNAFSQFLEQNPDFVEMLKHWNKLFDPPSWDGIKVISLNGLIVSFFYNQFNFLIGGKNVVLDVDMTATKPFQGTDFMTQRNELNIVLQEYLSGHGDAVHAFPETVEAIQKQIQEFNPIEE